MLEGIESVTTAAMGLALDAASMRHQAIASNIANANTAGYVPLRVNFSAQFDDMRRDLRSKESIDPFALTSVMLHLEPAVDDNGAFEKVQLDTEVAKMAQNTLQYEALAKGLNKHFAILANAVAEGKK